MMRAARMQARRRVFSRGLLGLLALCCASLAAAGCERKAPGPAECAAYAEAFINPGGDERLMLALEPKIDAVTQLCLTTPYDRELIACAQSTGRARDCFDVYKRRTRQAP